jgi:hypothetical protein
MTSLTSLVAEHYLAQYIFTEHICFVFPCVSDTSQGNEICQYPDDRVLLIFLHEQYRKLWQNILNSNLIF